MRADSLAGLVGAIIMNTSEATEMNTTGSGEEVAAADVPRQDDAVSRLTPSKDAAADDVPRRDDAVLRLEQRMDLMEARFQREISDVKRVSVDLLTKNTAIESQLSSMRDENDSLKARVSQLDEELHRLEGSFVKNAQNIDWRYLAPDPPPDSYWIEKGYDYGSEEIADEDYLYCVNNEFFKPAKEQSEMLRRCTFGIHHIQGLYFGNEGDISRFYSPLIRYDDTLLPHWVEFCDSLLDWQFAPFRDPIRTYPFRVFIGNVELPANVLDLLYDCLRVGDFGHVEELTLRRNEFQGSDGINFAIKIMQSHQEMAKFCYERNPAYSGQDCQLLVDAIVCHPNISTSHLQSLCAGGRNGHDQLVDLLRKKAMKSVDFSDCGVKTDDGRSALFDIIKLHPNLDFLYLDDNKLNDKDAIRLADALRHNRTLSFLSLMKNEVTQLGGDTLKKVIYDDSSLNALADSNHVCTIKGVGLYSWVDFVDGQYNIYRNEGDRCMDSDGPKGSRARKIKRSRARKIFHLLVERNKEGNNAYYFETEMGGITLKVVPFALAAVQIYGEQMAKRWDNDVKDYVVFEDAAGLSITYELIRSWHMPALCGENGGLELLK